MNIFRALLDSAPASGTSQAGFFSTYGGTIILVVVMVAVFYFFLYRPQKKQEKEAAEMKNNLAVGDEVTTIGGLIGEIVSIKEETCVIETSKERTKIRILKSAISKVDVKASEK
ncbi:MAG: preprotein translocase subunit YajC [Clostridia bacterium]|nr:preprotein translocase subunit YajC [Clostridia bacterium]